MDRAATIWDVAVTRTLRSRTARFDLDVSFASECERVVLFGPSGAGKTQTLRLIAGTADPDRGHVRIAGRTLVDTAQGTRVSPQRRRIGYVYQDYALFPHLTVRQNVAFARAGGWINPARGARHDDVEAALASFGLAAVADLYPMQLSGGQRQRTALARALVSKPQALLLDEPFAALDYRLRARLRDDLLALQESLRLPMLLITHDDDDVRVLAQHVIHLEHGRVVAQPSPVPVE